MTDTKRNGPRASTDGSKRAPEGTSVEPSDDASSNAWERPRMGGVATWLAAGWLVIVFVAGGFASRLPTADPNAIDVVNKLAPPMTDGYPLGTDGLGRDILARLIDGARVSLAVSLTAVAVGVGVGGLFGAIAGHVRGWFDSLFVAAVNVMLAFPAIVLLLALVSVLDQSLVNISLVVGLLSVPIYARVARANSLAVSERDYVAVAHVIGASRLRILFREVMPFVLPPVMAFALTAIGVVIVAEGTLAFLGLSVKPPAATWGSMIAEGRRHDETHLHVVLIPSLVMFLTVLSFNFLGETVRTRLAPVESKI